jgi:hypothetical protein
VDVGKPSAPKLLGICDTPGFAYAAAVDHPLVYVADDRAGVIKIDASDPQKPRVIGKFDTPGEAVKLILKDGYVYVCDTASLMVLK